jgi:hypothetical protein
MIDDVPVLTPMKYIVGRVAAVSVDIDMRIPSKDIRRSAPSDIHVVEFPVFKQARSNFRGRRRRPRLGERADSSSLSGRMSCDATGAEEFAARH